VGPPVPLSSEKESTVPLVVDGGAAKALEGILSRVSDVNGQGAPTVIGDPSEQFERPSLVGALREHTWQTNPLVQEPKRRQDPAWRLPLLTLLVVGLLGGAMWLYRHRPLVMETWSRFRTGTLAVVSVESDPPGATVTLDGKPVSGVTPTRLPTVPEGKYILALSKPGYQEAKFEVWIPRAGNVQWPPFKLTASAAQAGVVTFTLRSEPTGAQVEVNGQVHGKTPVALELPPNTSVKLRVSYPGYVDIERELRLSEEPFQAEVLTLEKVEAPPPPPTVQTAPPEPKPVVGTVRFAVTPWADVTCGKFRFGSTPFEDKHLPPGIYDCVFRNPEFGAKSERVEVRANVTSRVTVRF
jgi:hypothetical protein